MDFPTRLRAAVSATDLSLEQISARLRERGTPVSTSSLSGWQSGICRPDRAKSLLALAELEQVLGLPTGELRAVLPRPGREAERPPFAGRESWKQPDAVSRLLARFGAVLLDPSEPQRISRRVRQTFKGAGASDTVTETALVRARRTGATRMFSVTNYEELQRAPSVARLRGLSFSRFRADPVSGLAAFELLLDPPLGPGEVALVEFTVIDPPDLPLDFHTIRVQPGTREVVLEALFEPSRRPHEIMAFRQEALDSPEVPAIRLTGSDVPALFQHVWLDPEPGIHGIRWDWGRPE